MGRLARFIRFYTEEDDGGTPGSAPILKTITGALLHITDALAKPAHELVAVLSPVQSGSGDPSPENVRPISGWTGVEIGKNTETNYANASQASAWGNAKSVKVEINSADNGVRVYTISNNTYLGAEIPLSLQADKAYVVEFEITEIKSGTPFVGLRNRSSGSFVSWASYGFQIWCNGRKLDALADVRSLKELGKYVVCYKPMESSIASYADLALLCTWDAEAGNITYSNISVSEVSSLPISWQSTAGTVYGGTFTLNEDGRADLVVTKGGGTIRSFSGLIKVTSVANRYRIDVPDKKVGNANELCSSYKRVTADYIVADMPMYSVKSATNSSTVPYTIYFADDRFTSATDFINAMGDEVVVYDLATPQTYHFDNIGQLQLFLGENTIWVDASDDLTLTYYADGNVSDLEALNTLLGGAYTPGDTSDKDALNILLGN